MQKSKTYYNTRFTQKVIAEADRGLESSLREEDGKIVSRNFTVRKEEERWSYDTIQEFLAAFEGRGVYTKACLSKGIHVYNVSDDDTCVTIIAPTREEIDSIAAIFERHAPSCKLPASAVNSNVKVYIGHGRNPVWRDLKDHLKDQHNYDVEAYEIGARAGHAIRDILEEMLRKSSIAFLVMTGEDETTEGKLLARQNVVHEVGLFQGKLGFNRAIVLLEEGTEEFSNISGIHQIRFPKAKIRETFGDVVAVLKREFD